MSEERVKVEPCPRCPTMKPRGSRYHAPLLLVVDGLRCQHGAVYWCDCAGRIPPPCCWGDYRAAPTGATPRSEAKSRLSAFEARMSGGGLQSEGT
jgi:hypothetical protein